VFILKTVKVICFHTLLQVLIAKELHARQAESEYLSVPPSEGSPDSGIIGPKTEKAGGDSRCRGTVSYKPNAIKKITTCQ